MKRSVLFLAAMAASVAVASPAMAWGDWKPRPKPPASSTSSGGSGGSHSVPEPGVLGLMGAGLIGLVIARRRKRT